MLPAVLLGELMAGVALGAAWPRLTAPGASTQQVPLTAVVAPAGAPQAGLAGAVPPSVVSVPAVSVPAVSVPAPAAAAVPPPVHTPPVTPASARNPFAVLAR